MLQKQNATAKTIALVLCVGACLLSQKTEHPDGSHKGLR